MRTVWGWCVFVSGWKWGWWVCHEACRRDMGWLKDEPSDITIPQSGLLSPSSLHFFSSRRALCIISIQSHACPILMWNYYTDKETAIWSDPLSLPLNYTSRFSASTEKLQREPGHFRSTQVLFILIPNVSQWKLLLLLQWIKNTLFWKWPAVSFALLRVQLNEWFWI